MRTRWITTIILILIAETGFAQTPNYRLYSEIGVETVAEDTFLSVRPGFDWTTKAPTTGCGKAACKTDFRLSVHLPLRFYLDDNLPDDPHPVRDQDWDQPSDFARVLKRLQFGDPSEPLFARIGELGFSTIGNGTLVSEYVNNVQTNAYRPGLRGGVNTEFGGLDLLVDQVTNPTTIAGRGFVRPFGAGTGDDKKAVWWKQLEVGFSFASDLSAPVALSTNTNRTVDGYDSPTPSDTTTRSAAGLDVAYFWSHPWIDLAPYVDLNLMRGVGLHGGVKITAKQKSFSIWLQLEAQTFTDKYLPQYFGTLYDIERFQFVGWGADVALPKARQLESISGGNGFRAATGFNVGRYVSAKFELSRHSNAQSSQFSARLSTRPIDRLSFALFYFNTNAGAGVSGDELKDLFSVDGAVLVSEARIDIWGPLYAVGRFDQKYALSDDGRYETNIDGLLGVGAQVLW